MSCTILLAVVSAALGQSTGPLPGDTWLVGDIGVSLDKQPKPRVNLGGAWAPFAKDAWGGLGEIEASALVFVTPAQKGNAGLQLWVGYGRPRPHLWLNFEAGLAIAFGWGKNNGEWVTGTMVWPPAQSGSVRVGFGPIAVRVMGFIVAGERPVLHGDHYSVVLEGLWHL
jgi:hypothetical protein